MCDKYWKEESDYEAMEEIKERIRNWSKEEKEYYENNRKEMIERIGDDDWGVYQSIYDEE